MGARQVWFALSALACACDAASSGSKICDALNVCNFRKFNFSCPTGMELVAAPTRNTNFTFRSADVPQWGDSSGDPTTYTPGVWNELHLRVAHHAWKYIGLLLYAVRADAGALDEDENLIEEPIGEWDVRADPDDFYVSPACGRLAVTHMSAKPKRMHHRFHWKPPVGLGRVTFRLLIKWCVASRSRALLLVVSARARPTSIRARAPYPRARDLTRALHMHAPAARLSFSGARRTAARSTGRWPRT